MKLCFKLRIEGEMRSVGRIDELDVFDSDEWCVDMLSKIFGAV